MALSVFWQDEDGEILEACPTLFIPSDYMNHWDEFNNTCCLRFLDDYGDTTFNQYQMRVLVEELEALGPVSKNPTASQSLESLIAFIRKAEGSIHTYIKFVGD